MTTRTKKPKPAAKPKKPKVNEYLGIKDIKPVNVKQKEAVDSVIAMIRGVFGAGDPGTCLVRLFGFYLGALPHGRGRRHVYYLSKFEIYSVADPEDLLESIWDRDDPEALGLILAAEAHMSAYQSPGGTMASELFQDYMDMLHRETGEGVRADAVVRVDSTDTSEEDGPPTYTSPLSQHPGIPEHAVDTTRLRKEGSVMLGAGIAAVDALGRPITSDEIDEAVDEYGAWHLPTLKDELERKLNAFEEAGSRGVDLADAIDKMRIVIAVREYKTPPPVNSSLINILMEKTGNNSLQYRQVMDAFDEFWHLTDEQIEEGITDCRVAYNALSEQDGREPVREKIDQLELVKIARALNG